MRFPQIEKLTERYNKSVNSNIKEIKLTTIEVGLILQEITLLSLSVDRINDGNVKLKQSIDMLTEIIKSQL